MSMRQLGLAVLVSLDDKGDPEELPSNNTRIDYHTYYPDYATYGGYRTLRRNEHFLLHVLKRWVWRDYVR